MTRKYTDISHFRAPYKNWPYLGMGGFGTFPRVLHPMGDDTPAPDPSTTTPVAAASTTGEPDPNVVTQITAPDTSTGLPLVTQQIAAASTLFTTDSNGIRVLTPTAALTLLGLLNASSTIFIDNDNVKLDPKIANDPRPAATDWISQHLDQGKTIVIGSPSGIPALFTPGVDVALMAVPSTVAGEGASAGSSTLPLSAVLARPTTKPLLAGMLSGVGPVGVALIALGVVGGVVLLRKKSKRHATSNPRRRRRARR